MKQVIGFTPYKEELARFATICYDRTSPLTWSDARAETGETSRHVAVESSVGSECTAGLFAEEVPPKMHDLGQKKRQTQGEMTESDQF